MARYKPYKYDQMVMVLISFQHQLEPGTLEHTINELVGHHIDLSVFKARYQNDGTGARAINPKSQMGKPNLVPADYYANIWRLFCYDEHRPEKLANCFTEGVITPDCSNTH